MELIQNDQIEVSLSGKFQPIRKETTTTMRAEVASGAFPSFKNGTMIIGNDLTFHATPGF